MDDFILIKRKSINQKGIACYTDSDIKEFIKILKKHFKKILDDYDVDGRKTIYTFTDMDYDEIFETIDRIVGEKY